MDQKLPNRDLVLVGAGHTNMHIARMWAMRPISDVRLTLINPTSLATYSGMLPGTLAGLYSPEEMEIDLYRFCAGRDIRLIVAEAVGLDPTVREVRLRDRPPIRFDICSVGLGSVPAGGEVWRHHPAILSIKPMATFRARLETRLNEINRLPINVCVVGAGAGGVEIGFCLGAMFKARSMSARITLLDRNQDILTGYHSGTIRRVRDEFERRGVSILTGVSAECVEDGSLQLSDGRALPADLVIWSVGAAPPPVLEGFELPKADDGFLAIRSTLQSTAPVPVFAVGDSASFVDEPVRKAGVYAVREGPILWSNIQRLFKGQSLIEYRPQRQFMSLLNTGDGRAIGEYLGCSAHGRWVWWLKNYIDRKFMRMYRDYRPMDPKMMSRRAEKPHPVMRCRGCGGKVGANVLSEVLKRLDLPPSPIVRQGLDRPDDAAILDPKAGPADVLTVDFFQAFLDDPYLVGRVAALNALSDVWASGADPAGALAMVTLPEGSARQQSDLLSALLAGGVRELSNAGATLLGGHTLEGPALTIGYTVVGQLHGREPFTKGRLTPGAVLILTKSLGTGVLLAAHGEARCRAEWMDLLIQHMLLGNGQAARLAREVGACAVTDVTGFGLAVHLLEMLQASGVSARISLNQLPVLAGARELSESGVQSTLHVANEERAGSHFITSHSNDPILYDPQTSGGLLIAIKNSDADILMNQLRVEGYHSAVIIGRVIANSGTSELIGE